MKKPIWRLFLLLTIASVTWGGLLATTGPTTNSRVASVRYSSQEGDCNIEAAHSAPFTLVVTDAEGERRFPSRFNIILLTQTAESQISSVLKPGRPVVWNTKLIGANYQVPLAVGDACIRIEPGR